jgi:hypothetical protein
MPAFKVWVASIGLPIGYDIQDGHMAGAAFRETECP